MPNLELGQRIRTVRESMEMSRPDFAAMLGIPETTLKNYELGYRTAVPASLLLALLHNKRTAEYSDYLLGV